MHITCRMLGQLHFFIFEGENRHVIIAVHLISLHMVVLLHAHCFTTRAVGDVTIKVI